MKYEKILCMVPTYKRPERLKNLVDSAYKNATDPRCVYFCLCVNTADELTFKSLPAIAAGHEKQFEIIKETTDQPHLANYFNLMYDTTMHKDAVVSMLGDDMEFQSPGWDAIVLNTLNSCDGKAVVYGDDCYIAHNRLCVHFFTSRELVTSTGRPFMCPYFHAEMIDVVWYLFGESTGLLRYFPAMKIKHNHDSGKDADKRDDTYMRLQPLRQAANTANNQRIAFAWATVSAANAIEKGYGKWNDL